MERKIIPIVEITSEAEKLDLVDSGIYSGPIPHREKLRKVLLVQPPAFTNKYRTDMNANAPLGIAYIAAVLERDGYEVQILDAFIEGFDQEEFIDEYKIRVGLTASQIKTHIKKFDPDVVGVTSMFTSQRKNAHLIASIVKEIDTNIPVIFGGAHATSASEDVLRDLNVDVVALGEGDNLIAPLIGAIERGANLSSLDGLAFRDINGTYFEIPKTTIIDNLDDIPYPARHLLPMEKYFAQRIRHGGLSRTERTASMITSRGCQYLCNFCTAFKVFTRKPRMRSLENVLGEIDELVKVYGVQEIFFEDDQIIAKRKRAIDLFDAMADRYNLIWDTPNGVSPWLLNDEILDAMKRSGCYRVNLAIESGSQFVLDKIINKPVKLAQIPYLVEKIQSLGMDVTTFLVIGNIGKDYVETLDQMRESFEFCRKLDVPAHVSLLTAYPGSEVLDIAVEKNYLVPNFDWDDLIIQKYQLTTESWTPDQVMKLAREEMWKARAMNIKRHFFKTFFYVLKKLLIDPKNTSLRIFEFAKQSLSMR